MLRDSPTDELWLGPGRKDRCEEHVAGTGRVDRAHVLRRLGRIEDACEAWRALAASPGRLGVVASIELSKLREHRLGDHVGALEAATRGLAAAERRRRLGRPEPTLEANLEHRLVRLRRRLAPRN